MELLPLLCALGVCSSLVLGNDVKAFAPEDLDGSGDDEDFSGSGEGFYDFDGKEVDILKSTVSLLVPTVSQTTTAVPPDVAVEEEHEREHTTKPMETTRTDDIEEVFGVQEPSEEGVFIKPTTQEPFIVGTTHKPTAQQPFTIEADDDGEKKHHHHHHHHHHNHTTTPDTSTSEDSLAVDTAVVEQSAEEDTTIKPTPHQATTEDALDVEKKHHHHHHHHPHHHTTTPAQLDIDEGTTAGTDVEYPIVDPEETTTSTPDEESEVEDIAKDITQAPEDSVHQDDNQEAASGSSSTPYVDEETTTTLQPDVDLPIFVESEEKTTVADETHTQQGHLPPHASTAAPLHESDIEETTIDELESEADHDKHELTTKTLAEDRHDHHHPPHHTTTSSTQTTTLENDFIVHTHEPKGRRVNVPHAETTAAVPVDEDEHVPEGMDPVDSSEGPSGDADAGEFFIEATVPVVQKDGMEPAPDDGSSDASHGIMDRKELLAGIIAGGVAGLVFAAFLVAFVFYRMKKKDEGSYSLEEPKQSNGGYQKPREQREFYA